MLGTDGTVELSGELSIKDKVKSCLVDWERVLAGEMPSNQRADPIQLYISLPFNDFPPSVSLQAVSVKLEAAIDGAELVLSVGGDNSPDVVLKKLGLNLEFQSKPVTFNMEVTADIDVNDNLKLTGGIGFTYEAGGCRRGRGTAFSGTGTGTEAGDEFAAEVCTAFLPCSSSRQSSRLSP